MSKHIIIVGGGISGLAVLHNLKKKYAGRPDIKIRLIEKESRPGGTIQTLRKGSTLFEAGPNGFLDSKDSTLNLIKDLGLEDQLLHANPESKLRYISLNNQLHALPSGPGNLLKFKPLSVMDKLRILGEPFIAKGTDQGETVYAFGKRRLGENFSRYLLDPMVSGVFGGDARTLHLKSAFPKIYELEQTHGSLIKAMIHSMRTRRNKPKNGPAGQPAGRLCSLREGMGQLISALEEKYSHAIQAGEEVYSIQKEADGFSILTDTTQYAADHVVLCTPAHYAANLLESIDSTLSSLLNDIPYAPMAIVGLLYKRQSFSTPPKGFGYLIPSCNKKEVLGVLFSSNIFENRADEDHLLLRVMIGGRRHPDILKRSEDDLLALARTEIENMFGMTDGPADQFIHAWQNAIPQYEEGYPEIRKKILQETAKIKNLHLSANYLDGVAMNDCTHNAQLIVEKVEI